MDTRDQALTNSLDYMINLIQLHHRPASYEGITHPGGDEFVDGGGLVMMMATNLPLQSPEHTPD